MPGRGLPRTADPTTRLAPHSYFRGSRRVVLHEAVCGPGGDGQRRRARLACRVDPPADTLIFMNADEATPLRCRRVDAISQDVALKLLH